MDPQPDKSTLIVILGPTAIGKTQFTIKLAKRLQCEVLNADSRQVFREMKIGTARPEESELDGVRHYFVASKSLNDEWSAGIFEREALTVLSDTYSRSELAILSGGSGLYIDAVCNGFDEIPSSPESRSQLNAQYEKNGLEPLLKELAKYDPGYFNKVDKSNPRRVIRALEVIRSTDKTYSEFREGVNKERPFRVLKIGLTMDRKELYRRIELRVDQMIKNGLCDEVKALQKYRSHSALQTVGYQEILGYLDGLHDLDEAVRLIKRNTRRFAKRQLTWFNKDKEITWLHPQDFAGVTSYLKKEGIELE